VSAKQHKVALYWRKSRFFGGLCPPGILTLTAERLSFRTEEGTLFDLPLSDARVTLSRWGTLTVHSKSVAGSTSSHATGELAPASSWDLLATAGQDSRPFSRSQQRELGAAGAKRPLPSDGTKPVRELAALLKAHGVQTEIQRPVNLYVLYGAIALAVAGGVALLLLVR
jgi:hypothetical protein